MKPSVAQRLVFGCLCLLQSSVSSRSFSDASSYYATHSMDISDETELFTQPNRFLYSSYSDDDDIYSSVLAYEDIDWTSYTLKYVSCDNIKTWRRKGDTSNSNDDDANSEAEEDVLSQRTLVVVRLCPATSCSSYNMHGCSRDYGEYVLPASDYLRIIHTYYINSANIDNYCAVCTACMSYVTQTPTVSPTSSNDDDYYSNRFLSSGNDDYFNDDAYGSGSYKTKPWYLDDDGQCMYQSVCSSYMSKCKKYMANNNDDMYASNNADRSPNNITNTTFGQCLAFRDGASEYYYYAAPHCAADGRTLHVGLYADSDCTSYVKTTGSSNPFASYTAGLSCLSCNYFHTSESAYALISDSDMESANYSSSPSKNHPLCSNVYNASAKCNAHLWNATKNQDDDLVCPYIESLEDNMYDAYGDVVLLKSSMYGVFGPFWRKGSGVASEDAAATSTKHRTVELVLLFLSMCVAASLSIHAYTLRRKLLSRKFISWPPSSPSSHLPSSSILEGDDRRLDDDMARGVVERTDSGIGVTRSGSYEAPVVGPPPHVYQPYGGAIPRRPELPSVRFTDSNSTGGEYIDRSTGRFA
jgi:hypothetical protein